MRFAVVVVACALLASACSHGGHSSGASTSTSTTSTSTPSTSTTPATSSSTTTTSAAGPTTTTSAFRGVLTPTSVPPPADASGAALLTAVTIGRAPGLERVVFGFRGGALPGYSIAFADGPVTADGSGDPVHVAGRAALVLHLTPAAAHDDAGDPTYRGPKRVTGDTREVTEVVQTGDFEGTLSWAIGLADKVPYRVSLLAPQRAIEVDVAPAP